MRVTTIVALAGLSLLGGVSRASACQPLASGCAPSVVAWPVYTDTDRYVGTIDVPVQQLSPLERSRFTGQPLTVIYNNPASLTGSVDPDLHLVPLPRARRSDTIGAYPVGY